MPVTSVSCWSSMMYMRSPCCAGHPPYLIVHLPGRWGNRGRKRSFIFARYHVWAGDIERSGDERADDEWTRDEDREGDVRGRLLLGRRGGVSPDKGREGDGRRVYGRPHTE